MYNDAADLRAFYGSDLGRMARRAIRRKLRAFWPDVSGMTVMGLGYATPYLRPFLGEAGRVLAPMPAQQGATRWPEDGRCLVALVHDGELPFPDMSIDRALIVHGLECSEHVRRMLRETWRVLSGEGRLLAVAPNRRGPWARFERTPFGHGHPYTPGQLARLLDANMFVPERTARALHAPPFSWRVVLRSAQGIEDIGDRWFDHLGGVVLVEARKQIYATPGPLAARAPAALRPLRAGAAAAREANGAARGPLAIAGGPD